jgi:hypothetical protein
VDEDDFQFGENEEGEEDYVERESFDVKSDAKLFRTIKVQ